MDRGQGGPDGQGAGWNISFIEWPIHLHVGGSSLFVYEGSYMGGPYMVVHT